MYLFLSHVLSPADPVFPGNLGLKIRRQFSLEKGDLFNQFEFEMCNHIGTHIDFPRHFNPNGKMVHEIKPEELVFNSPVLVDIPKNDGELIDDVDLRPHSVKIRDADLLLVRTGFECFRKLKDRYSNANPALARSLAKYVLENMPRLRAIGIDLISAGNASHPDDAIDIHRALLGYPHAHSRYVLIIEDMALNGCPESLEQVIVLPLRIEGADGAPCTVLASCR